MKVYYSYEDALNEAKSYYYYDAKGEVDNRAAQSDAFSELVGDWSGTCAAFNCYDEGFNLVEVIGYYTDESVSKGRARKHYYMALATFNADPFLCEGDALEDVATFFDGDVSEQDLNLDDAATLLGLDSDNLSNAHLFTNDSGECLIISAADEWTPEIPRF